MKITVLIAEDDPVMRHILRKVLKEIPGVEVAGEAKNGYETVRLVKDLAPQVVFLDIAMPGKDGLYAAREISNFSPGTVIVFATAYEDYTHEAFEVYAFDYLIKPYKIDRIRKTMERIRLRLSEAQQTEPKTDPIKIIVKEEHKKTFINVKDIIYITREGRDVVIFVLGGAKIKTTETLENLEKRLSGSSFFRSHRGFIINLNMVKEIQPWGKKTCNVIMNNVNQSVIITKAKARELEKILS
ncbi:MAG: Transcriptional regulatory protein YpdB [Pelotomaculum sp. PtaB.Bin104]|nr:MAG: Transcriptional regulatory protein YpdB [Pelotomaculum sp. PtaB.Bin104]